MKKVDKLILASFLGPFFLTFMVVVFILLNIHMLKYFDDIIGKGLDWWVLGRLFFYFAIFTIPTAMPDRFAGSVPIEGNVGNPPFSARPSSQAWNAHHKYWWISPTLGPAGGRWRTAGVRFRTSGVRRADRPGPPPI